MSKWALLAIINLVIKMLIVFLKNIVHLINHLDAA